MCQDTSRKYSFANSAYIRGGGEGGQWQRRNARFKEAAISANGATCAKKTRGCRADHADKRRDLLDLPGRTGHLPRNNSVCLSKEDQAATRTPRGASCQSHICRAFPSRDSHLAQRRERETTLTKSRRAYSYSMLRSAVRVPLARRRDPRNLRSRWTYAGRTRGSDSWKLATRAYNEITE